MLSEPAWEGGSAALVTGANGAMGRAIVERLVERRLRVFAIDRDPGVCELAEKANIVPILADLSCSEGIVEVFTRIGSALSEVSVVVNNAGLLSNHKLDATTIEEWRGILSVNLDAAFLLTQRCIVGMRNRRFGRVINMCSLAMKTGGLTAGTAYSVSKGALAALTFSIARETARDGITVNAIAPAYVVSPMVTDQLDEGQRKTLLDTIPVGRFCQPEEVAHVVDFLASPLSGFITGEVIDINGGLHLD